MKSVDQFIQEHQADSYEQLAIIKNRLIKDLEYLTCGLIKNDTNIKPTPEEIYNYEKEYLIAIEPLLDKKYIEEYIVN